MMDKVTSEIMLLTYCSLLIYFGGSGELSGLVWPVPGCAPVGCCTAGADCRGGACCAFGITALPVWTAVGALPEVGRKKRFARMQSTTNMPASQIVVRCKKSEARRTPKTAPTEPGPPRAPASPSPLDDCASTTAVITIQSKIIRIVISVNMVSSFL